MALGLTEEQDFVRIVLLLAAVLGWSDSDILPEHLRQVCLAGEPTICGYIDDADFPPFQKESGVVNPALEYILVRRHASGRAKHFKKVAAAVACLLRQRRQADLRLKTIRDVFQNTLQGVWRKR